MASPTFPPVPVQLKNLQPYLKIANEHDNRDIAVSFWCRLYVVQVGMKLSTKTSQEVLFLKKIMEWLEATRKANHDNETITNDVASQAYLENWTLKIFLYADKNDRESNFTKSVIQSFFTAGLLYDVIIEIFGDLGEEAARNRKYAKWRATYIHNCLKNGQTPVPGPAKDSEDNSNENIANDSAENEDNEDDNNEDIDSSAQPMQPMQPIMPTHPTPPTTMGAFDFPSVPEMQPNPYNPAPTPTNSGTNNRISYEDKSLSVTSETGVELSVEQTVKAQKYIKWAGSALNYEDVPTAILNLKKALHLLTTGEDPVL